VERQRDQERDSGVEGQGWNHPEGGSGDNFLNFLFPRINLTMGNVKQLQGDQSVAVL